MNIEFNRKTFARLIEQSQAAGIPPARFAKLMIEQKLQETYEQEDQFTREHENQTTNTRESKI